MRQLAPWKQSAAPRPRGCKRSARLLTTWQLPSKSRPVCFPNASRRCEHLSTRGFVIPLGPVGGDYYDSLDLGSRRLGLVGADIAGKGIGAALLMANLQAALRSQCATEEFGEQRLLAAARQHSQPSLPELLSAIADQAREFGSDEQADDITLIVANCT